MGDAVMNLKTNSDLLRDLKNAKKATPEEVKKQRVSFVYGSLDSNSKMSKDQVRTMVEKVA